MSNNKHNSNKPTANTDGRPNPNAVIAAARAKQEEATAKADVNAKQPVSNESGKAVSEALAKGESDKADDKSTGTDTTATTEAPDAKTISSRKRKTKDDWKVILEDKEKNNLTAADLVTKYGVSEGSVYAWASRFKTDAEKAEIANLTPLTAADTIKKLLEGVDAKLAAYDADIAKAKEMVANEAEGRKKIEDSKKSYQDMIDTLTNQVV